MPNSSKTSVYIGSYGKEATLNIRGVTETVTDRPEFVFLMGEDGISAVKRDTLEVYWTDVGGQSVLTGDPLRGRGGPTNRKTA